MATNTRCAIHQHSPHKHTFVLASGCLQVYQKLVAKYHILNQLGIVHTDMFKLDYDEQEDTMWMSKIFE